MCIPVSTVLNLSALRSAARGDLVVPRTRLQLGNFQKHAQDIFSNVPKLLFPEYEQRTLYGTPVVTLAVFLRLIICRFFIIIINLRCPTTVFNVLPF